MSRLTQHLLTQHNYYPLYPAVDDVSIEYERFELHATMPVRPHIMIIPSDLRYFVKEISGSCCVNPGRLAKGQVGGTFAKFMVHPALGENLNKPISQRVTAQIVRI